MTDLKKARLALSSGEFTCVICKNERIYTSKDRGVKPLVELYEAKTDLIGFSAADKVVGKGAAYLYVLLKVNAVYAGVISTPALTLLNKHGILVEYDALAEHIINRRGDGICPFEAAVMDIDDKEDAYRAIISKMNEMNIRIRRNNYE